MRDSPARPIFEDPDLAPKDAAAHVIKCISDYKPDLITPSVLMQCPPDVQLLEAGLGNWILNGYEFWGAEKKIGFRAPMAGVAVIALPLEAMAAVPITVGVAAVSGAGAVLANAAVPVVHGAGSFATAQVDVLMARKSFEQKYGFPRSKLERNADALDVSDAVTRTVDCTTELEPLTQLAPP